MDSVFDVIVVGAGPAGSTAAYEAATRGASVAVVEKEAFPRYKTCGGGLTWRTLRELPQEFHAGYVECRRVDLHFLNSEQTYSVTRPYPLVSMTMRSDWDARLLQRATDAGAKVFLSTEFLSRTSDGIETSKGFLKTKCVIAADGANSKVARSCGWERSPAQMAALEHEITVDNSTLETFSKSARFDFDTVSRGYAWVFPKAHHLSVGIASYERNVDLRARLNAYLTRIGITRIEKEEKHGYLIPLSPRPGGLAKKGILLVGDAGGLADPITAEGLYFALKSGKLAGEASVSANPESVYRRLLKQEILPELRLARGLSKLLYDWPRLRDFAFRRMGTRLSEAVAEIMAGNRSYRRLLTFQ